MAATQAMQENTLDRLKNLIRALKQEEIALAEKHLSAYDTYDTPRTSKMFTLYKVILKEPDIQYKKLKKNISPESTPKSFGQLLSRTISRIKESLILDINIFRKGNYSKVFQKKFQIRKQIVQAKIISSRGLSSEAITSYKQIINTAKKYELYDELIEVLQLKQNYVVNTKGLKAVEEMENEIDFFTHSRNLYTSAVAIYNKYYAVVNFSSTKKGDVNALKKTIEELKQSVEETSSANIETLFYLLSLEYHSLTKNYTDNKNIGEKFLNLISKNPAVESKARQVYVLNLLIENQILLLEFGSAVKYGKKAMGLLAGTLSRNLYYCLELLSQAYFYLQEFDKVEHYHKEMEQFPLYKKEVYQRTKVYFVRAMSYFVKEQFREALLLLNNMEELEKEKVGWNVWIRVMRILCSIELLKLNMIDYDVESFRRYMERTDKRKDVKPRDKLILKVLIDLDRNSYDFKETYKSRNEELEELNKVNGEYSWEAQTPELILFHDWYQAKMKNIRYEPDFDRFRREHLPLTER
jgi:hypothetical protein